MIFFVFFLFFCLFVFVFLVVFFLFVSPTSVTLFVVCSSLCSAHMKVTAIHNQVHLHIIISIIPREGEADYYL